MYLAHQSNRKSFSELTDLQKVSLETRRVVELVTLEKQTPTKSRQTQECILYSKESRSSDLLLTIFSNPAVVSAIASLLDFDERNNTHLIRNMIYPQKNGIPVPSANGKYSIKLNLNGAFRKVDIDDELLVESKTGSLIALTTDRFNCLWPALIEKAIFKIYSCGSMNLKSNPCYEVYHMSG